MAIDIAKMRAKLEASKNPQAKKEDSTKWKPSEGDQTLRILPTQDGCLLYTSPSPRDS